jgi:hypothetical protein
MWFDGWLPLSLAELLKFLQNIFLFIEAQLFQNSFKILLRGVLGVVKKN